MNKALILMACLVVLPSLTLALPIINAQSTTSCNKYDCITTVDMSKYVSAPTLTTAKSLDYSKDLPVTTAKDSKAKIESISYKWDKDMIVISGTIKENTYWTLDVAGYTIDPWWNYTSSANYIVILNETGLCNFGETYLCANAKTTNYNSDANMLIRNTTIGSTECVEVQKWNLNASCIPAGATINSANLTWYVGSVNTYEYTVSLWNATDNWNPTTVIWNTKPNISALITQLFIHDVYTFNNFTITNAVQSAYANATNKNMSLYFWSSFANDANMWNSSKSATVSKRPQLIINYSTSSNYSIFYTVNLYLNGNESNITMDNSTALSIVAYNNLTLNSSIYVNGTLKNNTVTNSTWTSFLPSGLYNITGYFFNASTNSTLTYWANLTYTAPIIPPTSNTTLCYNIPPNAIYTLSCSNNNTLLQNWTVGNETCYAYQKCANGCDSYTQTCNLSPLYQGFLSFGVIIAFIIILLGLDKVLKR
jgi:hypothetical protein